MPPENDPSVATPTTEPTDSPRDRPLLFVLHGARGDLAKRLVLPSLAHLQEAGLLPDQWALIGTGRENIDDAEFAQLIRDALDEFGDDKARSVAEHLTRHATYAADVEGHGADRLPEVLDDFREEFAPHGEVTVVHYLAVPPSAFGTITTNLRNNGLTEGVRVVYEKPYGTSPESFRQLDATVHEAFDEEQVFRIDHFLGKEAVQDLHVLRFANGLFSGAWHRDHIEQVQVDVPETLDVAQRAGFYDATGAALDMLVTHLFQVAAEVAMEPPAGLDAANLAAAREGVIAAFRPLDPVNDVVYGQFEGYTDIDGIDDDSTTETFVAARLWVDTDRWHGVPFLLRTGKKMAASAQRVTLVLRTPDTLYGDEVGPNTLSLSIAGDGAIELQTTLKRPGPDLSLGSGHVRLELDDVEPGDPLPAYASLLHDVLTGDRTLFTTTDGLAATWRAFAPLLGDERPKPLPYAQGSWGPQAAIDLAGPGGWVLGD